MNQKTTNVDVGFTSNPWKEETLSYPSACRLFYPLNDRCYVSKDASGALIFFVTTNGKFRFELSKKYHGFSLELIVNEDNKTHLVCKLSDVDLQDKFSILAKSVAKDTCELDGQVLLEKAIDVINSWSSFFKPDKKGLTKEEHIGIWGELYFLLFQLMPILHDQEKAVEYWIGPTGKTENRAKQDFTLDHYAFELKTTLAGGSKDIKISSKDQLDKITPELYLVNLYANETNSDEGISLEEINALILKKLTPNTEIDYIKKSHYFMDKANDKQKKEKFLYTGSTIYHVEENFPRLDNTNIPSGIIDVKYIISAASIRSFIINKSIGDIIK